MNEIGFLPFFANDVPGFSAEEHTASHVWWTGNKATDPWEWREEIAASHAIAYGKFFDGRAGFISVPWLPYFANARRSGWDFDGKWQEGKRLDIGEWKVSGRRLTVKLKPHSVNIVQIRPE